MVGQNLQADSRFAAGNLDCMITTAKRSLRYRDKNPSRLAHRHTLLDTKNTKAVVSWINTATDLVKHVVRSVE